MIRFGGFGGSYGQSTAYLYQHVVSAVAGTNASTHRAFLVGLLLSLHGALALGAACGFFARYDLRALQG